MNKVLMDAVKADTQFMDAVRQRRSFYGLSKELVVAPERIQKIVSEAVKYSPSAFKSARVVLLFGEQSDRLWDITKETLRRIIPDDQFAETEARINGFRSGYGTVLYFEDERAVDNLQRQFPDFAAKFPVWSDQSSGMLQFVIWTALVEAGLGASLQHYNPLIDAQVAGTWNIPQEWKLNAQMPFGKPTFAPEVKTFEPLDERIRVIR